MSATSTQPRLLFVDDEPAILNAVRRLFRREPYEVETANDGPQGLDAFRRFRPAVVVSDLRMPGMTGVDFLAKVREIDPECVRIMLTGCTDLPAAEAAINQGEVWRFLTKPWNDEDLRATIAAAIERRRLVDENRLLTDKLASIGLLAGGVAHELNNPIGGILAYAQMLRKEFAPETSVGADLAQIEDAANRCKRIVGDLLDFARSSKSSQRALVSLSDVAAKAISLARFQLRGGIEIKAELDASVPPVLADGVRLEQVTLNLLTNAIHAIDSARTRGAAPGSAGRIVVRTSFEGGVARMSVTDDGPGITEEILPRIFDAFFTTKAPGQGTGLGLTVCQGIVRDHCGAITVASKPGEGATFTVAVPIATAAGVAAAATVAA